METLTVRMSGNIAATLQNQVGVQTVTDVFSQPITVTLDAGTGDGKADQIYSDQRTLPAGQEYVININSMNGSNDGCGLPFSLACVKMVCLQNLNGTCSNTLVAGGSAAGVRGWTSAMSGTVTVNGTATFFMSDCGGAYSVPSGSGNNLLKIANPGASAVEYRLLIVGATST